MALCCRCGDAKCVNQQRYRHIDKDKSLILKQDSVNNGTIDNNGLLAVNKSLLLRSSIQGEGTGRRLTTAPCLILPEKTPRLPTILTIAVFLRVSENSQLTAEREIANHKVIVNRGVIHNSGALLLNGGSSVEMGTDAVFNTKRTPGFGAAAVETER